MGAGPQVGEPGFGDDGVALLRAQAREAAAAEPREPVARSEDLDADGVPC